MIRLNGSEYRVGADSIGCDYNQTPLMIAARQGYGEMVRFLLRKGADINAVVEGRCVTTALQASLKAKNSDMFYLLLANGARINAPLAPEGSGELAYAARMGNIQIVQELLDRGAEINSAPPVEGRTALQEAAGLDPANMAMVQLLLKRGADINAPGKVMALQAATQRGNFQLALLFLEAGADINARAREEYGFNPNCRTALETAAFHGRLDILYLLLKAGADTHLPVEERYVSAASIAHWRRWRGGHIVIAEILEGWKKDGGAQYNPEGLA